MNDNLNILYKIEKLPRVKICNIPTPIERIVNLFDAKNNIYIKRDDLTIPIFGGNKARKEEFIFGNLIKNKKDGILWSSSAISNEFRIISYFGYRLKKKVVLITWGDKNYIKSSPNISAAKLYGAKILYYPTKTRESVIFDKIAKDYIKKNFYIQSIYDEALGAISYINCGREINEYMKKSNINFDYIFLCSTGATQIGLEISKIIFNWDTKIIGINQIPWKNKIWLDEHFNNIWKQVLKILDVKLKKPKFYNKTKYAFPGYGKADNKIIELCKEFEVKEGILLDPFYSGKAFWGMLDFLKNQKNKKALFIHTGGGINFYKINPKISPISFNIYAKFYLEKQIKLAIKFLYKNGSKIKNAFKKNS